MRIDLSSLNPASLLQSLDKSSARQLSTDASSLFSELGKPAKSAESSSILPPSSAQTGGLSFETILSLQSLDPPQVEAVQPPSATDIFLQEAQKDPMERMREQIMKDLGITQDDLDAMPPEERRAMEDRIRELIEEKFRQANNAGEGPAQSNGEMLQQLL